MKKQQLPQQKRYHKRIRRRKMRLYAALFISFILALVFSTIVFTRSYDDRTNPQIKRAVIQVARLLPQLEQNEAMLRQAYDQMVDSWESVMESDSTKYKKFIASQDADFDRLVSETLSWMNRVTKLKIGHDGFVFVVSKDTDKILAHPNEEYVGRTFLPYEQISEEGIISIKTIRPWTEPEDLNPEFRIIAPHKYALQDVKSLGDIANYYRMTLSGCVMDYEDTYIICGTPFSEMLSYILTNALTFSILFLILMWLLVKWICLVIQQRRETAGTLRPKLIAYASIVCIALFGISWYTQVLSDVTNDLKTMSKHADVAVETLDTYRQQRDRINDWLDEFYIAQCQIAAQNIAAVRKEELTRQDMQMIADVLKIKYAYVFDQQGRVIVTNSPYDHFALSENPQDPSYEFRALLDGVFGVIHEPGTDPRFDEYIQYAGVSTRNDEDLCDGFVMIAVDPALRDDLLSPLSVDTVLSNMTLGLPDYAFAVDKSTLKIAATTGVGFKDASISSLGLTEEDLADDFSGILTINGTPYYAGVSESEDMYLVLAARRSGYAESFVIALRMALFAVAASLFIILLTLFRYQRDVIDDAPVEQAADEEAVVSGDAEPEDDAAPKHMFSRVSNLIHIQQKKGFEERWHVNRIPKAEQTPEQRIKQIVYRLLLIFCLFILLPSLYQSLDHSTRAVDLNNLAYLISGNWQEGLNIFAVTSCIFLLCAMYVAVVLLNRVLYLIARASDMRVETVCLLLRNALKYICVVIFIYYGLAKFGVATQTLLASAGILSLMISFGAKDMVSDIIAGFFTIFEGSYKVGDFITVGNWFGTVVEIGLRTTKVRFFSETKIFNNSSMRDIINSDGTVARKLLKMPISYDADLTEVEAVLEEELPKLMDAIPGLVKPPVYDGVDSFADSRVNLRIAIYVKNGMQGRSMRALNREIKLIFDRRGIEIPFNQIVVHEARAAEELKE